MDGATARCALVMENVCDLRISDPLSGIGAAHRRPRPKREDQALYLTRITYCSELDNVDKEAINDILEVSRRYNAEQGISGLLLFNGTYFLQCLEGGRSAVNETYQRIMRDRRHRRPVLLAYEEIAQRDFADWAMAYVPWTKEIRRVITAFSVHDDFDPYLMSAQSAIGLLRALRPRLSETGATASAG
jgi:hypothetical protein